MKTHSESTLSFDNVVALNIKRLRNDRRWTAKELAERLTEVLQRRYTRSMVGDMEGRRERALRWSEVVALCFIFDVPVWDLVLPREGEVDARVPTAGEVTVTSDDPRFADLDDVEGIVRMSLDRDGLAMRLFGLDAATVDSKELRHLWEVQERRRSVDALAVANALLPRIRELIRDEREGSES